MKPAHSLLLLAWSVLAVAPCAVFAQATAPTTGAAPTAPAGKPPPRRLTADELREVSSPPGEIRPEDPVVPQIKLPIGRKQPVTPPPARRASGSGSGGIDDAAARCLALSDPGERAACRAREKPVAKRNPG